MKAENGIDNVDNPTPTTVSGDVIGETAYSERFVLKILLKLANRDTLTDELKGQFFDEELCTLWEMTAERDVVLYLLRHDALQLFTFALPVIDSPRIIELIIGTIANMCCHKEVVDTLMANMDFLQLLMDYIKCDDCQILKQILRMVSTCLCHDHTEGDNLNLWMNMFTTVDYANIIYFILTNSSNKELLITAFENLNTIFINCQNDENGSEFADTFITPCASTAVYTGYCEYRKLVCSEESLERFNLITLTLMFNILSTNQTINSKQAKNDNSAVMNEAGVNLIHDILLCYESKMLDTDASYKIDPEILAVLEATTVYIESIEINRACSPNKYFTPSYKMWKVLTSNGKENKNLYKVLEEYMDEIKNSLCSIMCNYMVQCTDENLSIVLDEIGDSYESIVSQINNVELQATIANRALNCRNIK